MNRGIASDTNATLDFWEHPSSVWGKVGTPSGHCFETVRGGVLKNICRRKAVGLSTSRKHRERSGGCLTVLFRFRR